MKRIIVTPAGRKRYLEVLLNNLIKVKSEFDAWVLWINTSEQADIDYMLELEKKYSWIKTKTIQESVYGSHTIRKFFIDCADPSCVYIRLDDDIVYIHKNSLKDLFDYRLSNPEPFLVYGNIINNAIISYIHQKLGNLFPEPVLGYDCMDKVGWNNTSVAEKIHRNFLESLEKSNAEKFYMPNWVLSNYERCSINVISWLGSEFEKFKGIIDSEDEETWLSSQKPMELKKPNIIFGKSLFAHFAYFTQRAYLDNTNILSKYFDISARAVANLSERQEIIDEILKNKLFMDGRGNIYHPDYESHLSPNGCWQLPDELADLIMFLKDKDINTFLNIGTFNGTTFNIISDFLNKNKTVDCTTVDPVDCKPIKKEKYKYLTDTSNGFAGKIFDLVIIDGCHAYSSVKLDYENVGKYAKICVFHDIDDDFVRRTPSLNGGVPKFWNEIKQGKNYIEIISPKKINKIMGFGVIIN
jgi:hypothetical protein